MPTDVPGIRKSATPAAAQLTNHFDTPGAAARYAANRPRGHSRVLDFMKSTLGDNLPVEQAIDVGCGTGHSTMALLPYAKRIVGIDASSEMLAQAARHPSIIYHKGHAEALPVRGGDFDLVTVSSAYHWFDHDRFLAEAARVLRAWGWLVVYKVGSTGRVAHNPGFDAWRRYVLEARFPKVLRNTELLTSDRAAQFGLVEIARETTTHQCAYTLDGYIENLLTHSSLIRATSAGNESVDMARAWLRDELAPLFANGACEFTHQAWIHVLRKESPPNGSHACREGGSAITMSGIVGKPSCS